MKTVTALSVSFFVALSVGCSRPPQPKADAGRANSSAGASASGAPAATTPTQHQATAGQRGETPTAGPLATDANENPGDAQLTSKVINALAGDAGLQAVKIDIDSNSGVVRLKGMVNNDDTKKRVQEVAQAVPGVKWVQNQLSIAPKSS